MFELAMDRQSNTFAILKAAALTTKPAPKQRDPFAEKAKFQMGSLSHLCGTALLGYQELPVWPSSQPDPNIRNPIFENKAAAALSDDESSDSSSNGSSAETSSVSSDPTDTDTEADSGSDSDSAASSSGSSSGASQASEPVEAIAAPAPRKFVTNVVRAGQTPAAKAKTPVTPAEATSPTVHEMKHSVGGSEGNSENGQNSFDNTNGNDEGDDNGSGKQESEGDDKEGREEL
eukprot:GILJ01018433.1.p1 GENE.GILJ01018433.1~~GILJ01018433.1.p1  ORF type:complete len:252 (+),score=49.57 GILJ01018433.1:63-758(+)